MAGEEQLCTSNKLIVSFIVSSALGMGSALHVMIELESMAVKFNMISMGCTSLRWFYNDVMGCSWG